MFNAAQTLAPGYRVSDTLWLVLHREQCQLLYPVKHCSRLKAIRRGKQDRTTQRPATYLTLAFCPQMYRHQRHASYAVLANTFISDRYSREPQLPSYNATDNILLVLVLFLVIRVHPDPHPHPGYSRVSGTRSCLLSLVLHRVTADRRLRAYLATNRTALENKPKSKTKKKECSPSSLSPSFLTVFLPKLLANVNTYVCVVILEGKGSKRVPVRSDNPQEFDVEGRDVFSPG
ncbi:hypothetical protein KQX54_021413 [Cotesia glomerata]|uniref:Uncharacterized protein n=1 Tax=Cotesia glomerata TaxID=32391 RepID=A0AAV7J9K0_COTGL|nr:hypothetical protein KQX54_021413 [Cotesia glomerata]